MRHFLLLIAFFLTTSLVKAQVSPSAASPVLQTEVAPTLAPDTLAALHNFYTTKRHALPRVLIGTVGLFALGFFARSVFTSSPPSTIYDAYFVPYYSVMLGIPILGGELLYYRQYNRRHERRAIEEFNAHKLRPSIKDQLKPKYFHLVR